MQRSEIVSSPAEQLILDGEAIVLRDDGSPQPFQVTMRRFGRKASDERIQAELPLSVFLFDCLFVDGESLLDRPLHDACGNRAGGPVRECLLG